MLLLALTGSIATGKSTVASLLSTHNLPLIDADVLARLVVSPGTRAYHQIVAHFSPLIPDLLNGDATLNRPALGRAVFGSNASAAQNRKALNGIVHPAVRRAMAWRIAKAWLRGEWCVVVDVPLLFESGLEAYAGAVVVVTCAEEKQLERLAERDGRGVDEARKRVESQMRVEQKVGMCRQWQKEGRGWVVDNNGSREELEREVARVMDEVKRGREGWWRWTMWALPPVGLAVAAWVMLGNRRRRAEYIKKPEQEPKPFHTD